MGTLSAVRPKLFLLCCALQRGEETPLWCGNVAHAPERSNLHRRVLSTNAIKDTVSVLYWYGELSSFDWQFLGRIFGSFFLCPNFARRCVTLCQSRCQCVGGCVLCFRCLWCGVCVWLGWGGGVPTTRDYQWAAAGGRKQDVAYDHTWLKAPHPVRFVKLSSHRLS